MRNFILIASLCGLALVGCDKAKGEETEKKDPNVAIDAALNAIADLTETYATVNEGLVPDTGVMVYCRGGGSLVDDDSLFKTLGFEPSKDLPGNADFCFNISSDRKKVWLSGAASPAEAKKRCLVVDLSGEKPVRAAIEVVESCEP